MTASTTAPRPKPNSPPPGTPTASAPYSGRSSTPYSPTSMTARNTRAALSTLTVIAATIWITTR